MKGFMLWIGSLSDRGFESFRNESPETLSAQCHNMIVAPLNSFRQSLLTDLLLTFKQKTSNEQV